MTPSEPDCELLFSYGTLRQENVQIATFGRILDGVPDAIIGYSLLEVDDVTFALDVAGHHQTRRAERPTVLGVGDQYRGGTEVG